MTRYAVGCMTGTSIDALDAALLKIEGHGLEMTAHLQETVNRSLGPLGASLRKIANQTPTTAKEIAEIAKAFGEFHADTIKTLIGKKIVDFISIHGQTVFHHPPLSWQLINPHPIALKFNVPVVFDLRGSDLAHGGEGAPLTPLADFIFYRASERRAIVNLGGFCNITLLPAVHQQEKAVLEAAITEIQGKDICACNQVLDHLARTLFNTPYDDNGKQAAQGNIQEEPFNKLVEDLLSQTDDRTSLGTGDELAGWLEQCQNIFAPQDLARTACAAIATVIIKCTAGAERLILAGGGASNLVLKEELTRRSKVPVELSDNYGPPASTREAAAFAVLGALCQDRVPITLPQVTGVKKPPISGTWILP